MCFVSSYHAIEAAVQPRSFVIQRPLKVCLCLLLIAFTAAQSRAADTPADHAAFPVEVKPTDVNLRYQGRWDTRDDAGPRCAYSACGVIFRFAGTGAAARVKEDWYGHHQDQLQVFVDGKPTSIVKLQPGESTATLAENLPPGEHTLELYKRTEPLVGTLQLQAILLPADAKLLPPSASSASAPSTMPQPASPSAPPAPASPVSPSPHRIEVIGDSISCGYGNEGKDQNEHFAADTENACESYGFLTARRFAAEYVCVAWSGKKMWPDNTVGEFYDRALPGDPASAWDFSRWTPDVVVVNLATNDFGGAANPDRAGWTGAYQAFVQRVRQRYPNADIYLATGSMMTDTWPPQRNALSTAKAYLDQVVANLRQRGDTHLHRIDFAPQDPANGLGSDWHPSVKTHHLMADQLTAALEKDLGWTRVE